MNSHFILSTEADRDFIARANLDASFRAHYDGAPSLAGMRASNALLAQHRFVRQVSHRVQVVPCTVAGVPCERLMPAEVRQPGLIIYLHGGGFVRGSLDLGRANAAQIAEAAGTEVLAVGYRQAPEHPFPAAPHDVAAVYQVLLDEGRPASSLAVVGESAGATLALGLAVVHQAQPERLPAGIAAVSPMADLGLRGASWVYNSHLDVADLATGQRMVQLYLGGAALENPLASPLSHHFKGCCPLLVAVGSHETMLSDAELLARKASEAGAAVRFDVYGEMPHGFTRFDTPVATEALARTADWCTARLAEAARPASTHQ